MSTILLVAFVGACLWLGYAIGVPTVMEWRRREVDRLNEKAKSQRTRAMVLSLVERCEAVKPETEGEAA
jgi:hypothetical protein